MKTGTIRFNAFLLLAGFMVISVLTGSGCTGQAHSELTENGNPASKTAASAGEKETDHVDEADEEIVRLTEEQRKEFGVELATAASGRLEVQIELPGEIVIDADRVAHVVPRVPGVVREVRKVLGDRVRKGEVLAILDSKELADDKAAALSAREKLALAQADYDREEDLWKKKISPAQDYLQAKQGLAEARIALRSAEQKLHALGFSDAYLARLPSHPDESYTRYEIVAPFDGTIIEKNVALGESHNGDAPLFRIADLNSVWLNLSVYQKDIPSIRLGQAVVVSAGPGMQDLTGKISYIGPLVGEQTRTAAARVVLPNRDGQLRPGLFVTAKVAVGAVPVPILAPKSALQTFEDRTVVFVEDEHGFEPKPVVTGRSNGTHVEITEGLEPGMKYVSAGAFTLKAQLAKGSFGDGHNH